MSKPLTPAEVTFQSFRHSQGSYDVQAQMLEFMEVRHDIPAALYPTEDEVSRIVRFLQGAARTDSHLVVGGTADALATAVHANFKKIRDSDYHIPRHRRSAPEATLLQALGHGILLREMKILSADEPWRNVSTGDESVRETRAAARVSSGQVRFLLLYGREGASTGHDEFDTMYRDIWHRLQGVASADEGLSELLSRHNEAVTQAELQHLGHPILGHKTALPSQASQAEAVQK